MGIPDKIMEMMEMEGSNGKVPRKGGNSPCPIVRRSRLIIKFKELFF